MNIHCQATGTRIRGYRRHTHDRWEIVCHLEGEARIWVDGKGFDLVPRDILLVPPNAWRSGSSEAGFCDVALRADELSFSNLCKLHDTSGDITALILMVRRVVTEKKEGYIGVAQALIHTIVEMIHQEIGTAASSDVERIKQIMYENISTVNFDLTREILATGYCNGHFRRRFCAQTGKTPLQYLTDLRISHAKQLLLSKEAFNIETVAEACGFTDSFYFSTCFKKHIGCSPRAFRKDAEQSHKRASSQNDVKRHHDEKAEDEQ